MKREERPKENNKENKTYNDDKSSKKQIANSKHIPKLHHPTTITPLPFLHPQKNKTKASEKKNEN